MIDVNKPIGWVNIETWRFPVIGFNFCVFLNRTGDEIMVKIEPENGQPGWIKTCDPLTNRIDAYRAILLFLENIGKETDT